MSPPVSSTVPSPLAVATASENDSFDSLSPQEQIQRLRVIFKDRIVILERKVSRLTRKVETIENHQHGKDGQVLIRPRGEPGYDYPEDIESTLSDVDSKWL
jgi:hypothetical protein